MGVFLLLIVAGLVVSVFKNLDAAFSRHQPAQPAQILICASAAQSCILGPLLWDTSATLPDKQFPGILFKTLLGYRDHIYLLQLIAYLAFLIGVGGRYFRSLNLISQQSNPSATPKPQS